MIKKSRKRKTKPKYIFSYEIAKIKRQNLFFSITYCEAGSLENYIELLRWSEIEKPKSKDLEIQKMEVFKNNISLCKLNQKNARKLLNILDLYNSTGLINNEIEPITAPTEKEIIFCISLYFGISPRFTGKNLLYKDYLHRIADSRNYLQKIKNPTEKEMFLLYLTTSKPKLEISIEKTNKTNTGIFLINKNLRFLVSEIMQDYEKGYLKVKLYIQPLRKKTDNQYLSEWKKFGNELNNQINEPKA